MADADTLPDLLLGKGIRLKRYQPGHNEHVRCPKCEGGTHHEVSLSVTIDGDGNGATWICHRGKCGWQDGGRLHRDRAPERREKPVQRPRSHADAITTNRPDWLYQFFAERHIGARTVEQFGCYVAEHWFMEPINGTRDSIVFPYIHAGEVANRKYRPHPEKTPQAQEKDALQTLFNVDRLGDAPAEIIWVEGEPDVMAMFECGLPHAVTLKDGAPQNVNDKSEKRFEALRTHADILTKARRIVLAGDNDKPGLALREEIARRLGRHRCFTVTWPDRCKDACDTLREHGPDAVIAVVRGAEPYPIDGLQRIKPGSLLALRRTPAPTTMTTGARATDAMLKLPTEGRLIVVTGFPSHGKTTWTRFVMVHTAAEHDRHWAVFSPEMQPWEHFAAECAEVYIGKPFWPVGNIGNMTEADIVDAETWLGDRVTMLVCDSEDDAPTLDWILERARAAVLRDGVTDLLIDPWNEIDQQRGAVSETDYIGRALQRLKAFALRHGCNVWIVAHPAKPAPLRQGEKRNAPGPYDLSGSAHWANKTDLGLTIHAPQTGAAEVHLWKPRYRRWGKRGAVALLDFDELTGRYMTPIRELAEPPPDMHWQDHSS